MIHIHSGETSQPRDFVARSVAACPHALKLASLTFKNLWEVDRLVTSLLSQRPDHPANQLSRGSPGFRGYGGWGRDPPDDKKKNS